MPEYIKHRGVMDVPGLNDTRPPKEICERADNWIAESGLNPAAYRKEVHFVEDSIMLKQPEGLETSVHWRLRNLSGPSHRHKEGVVTIIPEGRVVGVNSEIVTPDHKLIMEFSPEKDRGLERHSLLRMRQLSPLRVSSETVAVLFNRASAAYYHWMLDVLPCVQLLRQCGIKADKFVINGRRLAPFQYATLDSLGISKHQIIESHDGLHLQAKQLVIPKLTSGLRPKWACQFLRRELMPDYIRSTRKQKRIYISRANASKRRLLNETDVLAVLDQYGFVNIELERLPLEKQIELAASAEVIAGPHGSGFTNMIFSDPGTKIIEFFSPLYVHTFYPILSNVCGHRHYYLIGEGDRPPDGTKPPNGRPDMTVNLDDLKRLLKLAGLS